MKKVLLSLVALIAAAGVTFAAGPAPAVTLDGSLSGNATLTWGIDIDNTSTGFKNANAGTTLKIKFYGEGTDAKAGEGDYGAITLKWAEVNGAVTGAVTVDSAKLYVGPVVLDILNGSNHAFDKATKASTKMLTATAAAVAYAADTATANGFGISLRDAELAKVLSFSLHVNSFAFRDTNTANNYNVKADIGIKAVPNATIEASVAYDMADAEVGAAAKLGYKLPMDKQFFEVAVLTDINQDAALAVELGALVWFSLGGTDDYDIGGFFKYAPGVKVTAYTGLVAANVGIVDVSASFGYNAGGIGFGAFADLVDLTGAMNMAFGADAKYTAGNLSVGGGVKTDTALLNAKAFVDVANVLPNTDIGAVYTSGDLMAGTPVIGTFDITLKIKY